MEIERVGQRVGLGAKTGEIEPAGAFRLGSAALERRCAEHDRQCGVFEHRQVAEGSRYLVGARDAGAHDPVWRELADVAALERDRARIAPVMPADDIDQRRFARSVGTQQRKDLAAADFEAHTAERLDAGKAKQAPTRAGKRGMQPVGMSK